MGHDASVAVCSSGRLLFSVAEERLSRIKHHAGFPIQALKLALATCKLDPAAIRAIGFSAARRFFPTQPSWSIVDDAGVVSQNAPAGDFPEKLEPQWMPFRARHWSQFAHVLEDMGLLGSHLKYFYVAHHRAHASSAFRFSGMDCAAIVTLDGWGGQLSGTIGRGL